MSILSRPALLIDIKQTTVYFFASLKSSSLSQALSRSPALKKTVPKPAAAKRRARVGKPVSPAAAPSVRERILNVAERMFAEHGMEGVGLRAITAAARVNLASIAYHFGSKDGLLEALFAQRAAPIAQERLRLLALCYEGGKTPTLEQILDAFLRPALTLGVQPQFGGPAFVKLRARLGTEPEKMSRKILAKAFDQSSRKFVDAIAQVLPGQPRAEIEWRYHFMLGTMFYTMANSGRIQSLTDGRCDPGDVKLALHHMIPFLAAGFRSAPVP
jgi:AcrR family transcriptional regulator